MRQILKPSLIVILSVLLLPCIYAQNNLKKTKIPLLAGEKLWSGTIKDGHLMPFVSTYRFNFYANNKANQIQPLVMSNKGLYIWSEEPFEFEINTDEIIVSDSYNAVQYGRQGKTLAEVRRFVAQKFFPASGTMPDPLLFERPQYNTWIELTYNQNQADILKYAHAIVDNGFPVGVLMIDDTWQEDYGVWRFHPQRFPDPKAMIDELHQMGFKVMLWICPFVSPDQYVFREVNAQRLFLMEKTNPETTYQNATNTAMINWWNGYSAVLDFTNPLAVKWFNDQLDWLVNTYSVDGFKFDAGDMDFYPENGLSKEPATPNKHCELYAQFGLKYPLNEYRACWKMAGQPLAQRLHDKSHNWEDLQKLLPHMITEGLAGYTFSCPDMIGGGEFTSFLNQDVLDQDLVVRSAQCHALMPMMQFSVAPWRILDKTHLEAVKTSIQVRNQYMPLIMELSRESAKTGDPIISCMEYYYPGEGLENILDQFMLGNKVMVAPILEKSASQRKIALPKGIWLAEDGKKYTGGKEYTLTVPLNRLPVFKKID